MVDILSTHRRALHRIPELDRELPLTQRYILDALAPLSCQITTPTQSSVCAYFDLDKEYAVAFRADMDALPVGENTGLDFCSLHPGNMHACGHDGHMAILLGLAARVEELKATLPHNVLLVFQPAEETTGGAKYICETGIFQKHNVRHIFGLHLWPALPLGVAASRPGDMLASSRQCAVTIRGKSSHVARAWEGRDALYAAGLFVTRAYSMLDEAPVKDKNRLLKFGKLTAGTVNNAIAAEAVLNGSLRTFSPEVHEYISRRMGEIADGITAETGCVFDINIQPSGYPAVINDEGLYTTAKALLGERLQHLPEPSMIAEDFSFYQQEMPGLFMLLGTGGDEPLHSDRFDFPEEILPIGLSVFESLLYLDM